MASNEYTGWPKRGINKNWRDTTPRPAPMQLRYNETAPSPSYPSTRRASTVRRSGR